MRKQPHNKNYKCPKCGGAKSHNSITCINCIRPAEPRVRSIIKRLADGMCIKEIASDLGISTKTVEYFWAKAKAEYGFQSHVDACRWAIKHGLTSV